MRASQPKKHKAACDQCNASKVKCPGGGVPCQRCADSSQPCHYSLARRIGKPPGSKNRKTLERLRKEKEGNMESINGGGGGGNGAIRQNNSSRTDSDEALRGESEPREGEDSQDPLHVSNTTSFWPISPLANYPNFLDSSQLLPITEQDLLAGDHGMSFDVGERAVHDPANTELPDVGGYRKADSRMPWADAPDDYWNVSSPPCCALALTKRRTSLPNQAGTSSSLQVPQTQVCSTQSKLARQNTKIPEARRAPDTRNPPSPKLINPSPWISSRRDLKRLVDL